MAVNGDSLREPNLDFFLALSNAAGAVVAAPRRGRATIVDDDTIGALSTPTRAPISCGTTRRRASSTRGSSDGTTASAATFLQPSRVADTAWQVRAIVDLDNDLRPDLLWHSQKTGDLYVWFMDGPTTLKNASYLTPRQFADPRWQIRGVADLDVDGHPDLLWHNQATGELYVWRHDPETAAEDVEVRAMSTPGMDGPWGLDGRAEVGASSS